MLRTSTPEPDFLEFLDTFNEHSSPTDVTALRPSFFTDKPANPFHSRQLPVSCSSQSRIHQPMLMGLQGFLHQDSLDLLPLGPKDQAQPWMSSPGSPYSSAEQHQQDRGAEDLLESLLESPPAQLLRPRDDVADDPLESLLDLSYRSTQEQLRELQGSSSSSTPVPGAASCTTRPPDLDSSNSQLEATGVPDEDTRIPAPRPQRASSPGSVQHNSSASVKSSASAISEETGMPATLDMQPAQDFRRQLFKGIAIRPMWDRMAPLPIAVIYDNTFASNWDVQLPMPYLQRHVTIGQLVGLSPDAWRQLVTGIVAKLVDLAPSCLDPQSASSQHFAALAAQAIIVYGIFGIAKPREVLALLSCHLQTPQEKDRARPWAKALARARFTDAQVSQTHQLWKAFDTRMARLANRRQQLLELIQHQEAHNHPMHAVSMAPAMIEPAAELMANVRVQQEVLLHTMRAFLYGICDPWQLGHIMAFNYPYHTETMDLIQFIQTL